MERTADVVGHFPALSVARGPTSNSSQNVDRHLTRGSDTGSFKASGCDLESTVCPLVLTTDEVIVAARLSPMFVFATYGAQYQPAHHGIVAFAPEEAAELQFLGN